MLGLPTCDRAAALLIRSAALALPSTPAALSMSATSDLAAARRSSKDTTCGAADPAPSPLPPGVSPLPAEALAIARFRVKASKVAGDIARFAVVVFPNEDIGAYDLPDH